MPQYESYESFHGGLAIAVRDGGAQEGILDVRPTANLSIAADEGQAAFEALLALANLGARIVAAGFDPDDIGLLCEALDSHEYWQLSEPSERNSGHVLEEAEERDPEIAAVRSLIGRLEKLDADPRQRDYQERQL